MTKNNFHQAHKGQGKHADISKTKPRADTLKQQQQQDVLPSRFGKFNTAADKNLDVTTARLELEQLISAG